MSTRGCIARATGDGWKGRYNHSDSYPTWLGAEVWAILHERFGGDAAAFLRYATEEHSGWSQFGSVCYCHDRGEGADYGWIEERGPCSETTCDPLFIEWVYVLDPAARRLTVLCSRNRAGGVYRHVAVGSFSLDGPEPDWEALEARRYPEEVAS